MSDLLCSIGQGRMSLQTERGVALPDSSFAAAIAREDLASLDEYLERYLDFPIGARQSWAETLSAERLPSWGRALGGCLAPVLPVGPTEAQEPRRLILRSSEPLVHNLPWELALDASATPLGLSSIDLCRATGELLPNRVLTGPRLKLLLVIARPDGVADVPHQIVARVLTTLNGRRGLPIDIHVLRPPSFTQFRHALRIAAARGVPFDVVHFDGHGTIDPSDAGPVGTFHFEPETGFDGRVAAPALAAALGEGGVPLILFNACRSAALTGSDELSSSLATAILDRPGVCAVVAMTHIVSATAARLFVEAFYAALLDGLYVSRAATLGRRALASDPSRPTPYGPRALSDWMVPVLYLSADVVVRGLSQTEDAGAGSNLLVARDDYIFALEQAFQASPLVILHGCAGIGKSVIKADYRRWVEQVRDQDGRSLDFVIEHRFPDDGDARALLERVAGTALAPNDPELKGDAEALAARAVAALAGRRGFVILEDYDIISRTIPDQAALAAARVTLGALISLIQHTDLQLLIVERAADEGLGAEFRRILVGPMSDVESSELVARVAPDAAADLSSPHMRTLMTRLDGIPGAVQGVVPLLDSFPAAMILDALDGSGGNCARALLDAINHADLERTLALLDRPVADLLPLFAVTGSAVDISLLNGIFINLPPGHPFKAPDPQAAYHVGLSLLGRGLAIMTGERGAIAITDVFREQQPELLCLRPHPFLIAKAAYVMGKMCRQPGREDLAEVTFFAAVSTRAVRAGEIMSQVETEPLADFWLARLALQFDSYEESAEAAFSRGWIGLWFGIYTALAKIRRGAGDLAYAAEWTRRFLERYPQPEDVGAEDAAHALWLTIANNEGKRLIDRGDQEAAIHILSRCLAFMPPATTHPHMSLAMVTYRVFGQALARLPRESDAIAALNWFDLALERARAAGATFQIANGLYDRACVLSGLNRGGEAIRDLRETLRLREGLPDPVETARIAALLARLSKYAFGDPQPKRDAMRGLSAAAKAHNPAARVTAFLASGDIAFAAGRYAEAERDFRAAARVAEANGGVDARICQRLGFVADKLGQGALAQDWFRQGTEHAERSGSPGLAAILRLSLD